MKILIIGAGGMLGAKLATYVASNPHIATASVSALSLVDISLPTLSIATPHFPVNSNVADLTQDGVAEKLIQDEPDVIYHLAAVVSGEAEENMEKGYAINLDGTRSLLEAIRVKHKTSGYTPKLIFASSIAVYGAPFPNTIGDDFHLTPQTSYGTQKAICELLIADFNRRGIIQGVGLRLPTVCIRPGLPNKAASGFFSNILREPLNGKSAILPVNDQVKHWFASPRSAVQFLVHATTLTKEDVGLRCNMNLPGLSATVAEQLDALRSIAGADIMKLIKRVPDVSIHAIVSGWPESFSASRAINLGFKSEGSMEDIIKVYIEDELSS